MRVYIQMITLEEIAETFELLADWEQRYAYLIELGEQLPAMPEIEKNDHNKVKGCMSQVWTSAVQVPPQDEIKEATVLFHGDCDTSIIKGVLALLIQLTSGHTVSEIESLNVDKFFSRLNLYEHLSPNRHFGIYSIVEQMKNQAGNSVNLKSKVA